MNAGTYKGAAIGFTIDSLLKLTATRGLDKKTTVLDFVVKAMKGKSEDETLLAFYDDLPAVKEAVRYPVSELVSETRLLGHRFEKRQAVLSEMTGNGVPEFVAGAPSTLSNLQVAEEVMLGRARDLASYFGEPPKPGAPVRPEQTFAVLQQFSLAFKRSLDLLLHKQRREKERREREEAEKKRIAQGGAPHGRGGGKNAGGAGAAGAAGSAGLPGKDALKAVMLRPVGGDPGRSAALARRRAETSDDSSDAMINLSDDNDDDSYTDDDSESGSATTSSGDSGMSSFSDDDDSSD